MPPLINLVGMRFGKLIVSSSAPAIRGRVAWMCICDCGKKCSTTGQSLRQGWTKSCGCLWHSQDGWATSSEYSIYYGAKDRCTNPNSKKWKDYGGRGIEFRFMSFSEFIKYLGPRPSLKHSLERISNDAHYSPGNVKWATAKEQILNRSRRVYFDEVALEQSSVLGGI